MSAPTLERVPAPPATPVAVSEHAPPAARAGFRADIQGLRAVAVLLVVLFHAGVPGLAGGYVGVDVFFVISGFLITGVIRNELARTGRLRFGAFYARRARRLLPSAAVVIIATVLMAWAWGPVLQFRTTATDAFFTAFYALNFRLAARGVDYQNATGPESPLQHFWSLAVEEQFYLVWPVLLLLAAVVFRRHRGAGTFVVVGAVTAASLWYSIHLTRVAAPAAYFSVFTRGWEFGVGALVGLAGVVIARIPAVCRNLAAWAGLVTLIGSAFVFDASTPFPGDAALVPVLGAAAVIVGTTGRASTEFLLGRKPLQLMGTLSYGWYLWHWPLLMLVPGAFGETFGWPRNLELSLLALWLAGVTYLLLETLARKPLLHPKRWLGKGFAISGLAAAVALVVPFATSSVVGAGPAATPLAFAPVGTDALVRALDVAAIRSTVPSNLTPALEAAADDTPVTNSGCHLNFLQTTNGACEYGDVTATRTVVLFGDSHAQQWQAALDGAAKKAHLRLVSWTKSACPVAAVDVVNPTLGRQYTECSSWRAATVAAIVAMKPELVVMSQSDTVPARSLSDQTWATATEQTIGTVRASGAKVMFLADTPTPTQDVPTCAADHLDALSECDWTRAAAYSAGYPHTGRHEAIAAVLSNAGTPVVDPVNWLCSDTVCPVVVGNELVYRDTSHLTNTYSATLAPVLGSALGLTTLGH